jgi:hypothetical protein
MKTLLLGGYPQSMGGFVEVVANTEQKEAAEAAAALASERSNKRTFAEMPSFGVGMAQRSLQA